MGKIKNYMTIRLLRSPEISVYNTNWNKYMHVLMQQNNYNVPGIFTLRTVRLINFTKIYSALT